MIRFLSIALICCSMTGVSQPQEDRGWLPGYIVMRNYDTLRGFVKIQAEVSARVFDNVRYRQDENGKKTSFAPEKIAGFSAGEKIFHTVRTPYRDSESPGEYLFMELIRDGHIRIYKWFAILPMHSTGTAAGGTHMIVPAKELSDLYLLKKGDRAVFDPRGAFKKKDERISFGRCNAERKNQKWSL